MIKKSRSFQKRIGNGFFMNGPLTSGGLTYKELSDDTGTSGLKNTFTTNMDINKSNNNLR